MNRGYLTVRVARKAVEATDICTFELVDPEDGCLPPFSAGSHIDVHIRDGLSRQYSLCNDPTEQHRYVIGVLREPAGRGGSQAMHDEVKEGDLIRISEPKNHFSLAHSARKSILLAGGIGVTPILCMAERLANCGADFEFHYCTRSRTRTAFLERISGSAFADRVHFHFDDGPPAQRLDIPTLLAAPAPGKHLYLCGPTGFMEVLRNTASEKGWSEDHVHFEYFTPSVQSGNDETDAGFKVRIASTGREYSIPPDKTVLAVLAENGVEIPSSCEQGICGTCLTRVLDGEPDHRDEFMTEAEHAGNDQFTPCCSRARSPLLVLDL